MLKYQFPKLKKAITFYNIPIDTSNISNVLSFGIDSNGSLIFKLKVKCLRSCFFLSFHSRICLFRTLYFKINNPCYKDFTVDIVLLPRELNNLEDQNKDTQHKKIKNKEFSA